MLLKNLCLLHQFDFQYITDILTLLGANNYLNFKHTPSRNTMNNNNWMPLPKINASEFTLCLSSQALFSYIALKIIPKMPKEFDLHQQED